MFNYSLLTLVQLALQAGVEDCPIAILVHVAFDDLAELANLGIQVIQQVQRYRFVSHRHFGATEFEFAMVADDHVFKLRCQ